MLLGSLFGSSKGCAFNPHPWRNNSLKKLFNALKFDKKSEQNLYYSGNWFVAADVCRALKIDPTATRRLDDDEKVTLRLTQGESNRTSDTTIVNEPGLYALVLGTIFQVTHPFIF